MNPWLLLIPFLSTLAGWFFNALAGNYLLNVYVKKKETDIANQISQLIVSNLSLSNLKEKMSNPTLIDKAIPMIETHIDEFLNIKLKEEIPMLGMFITTKTTDKVKEVFINQLRMLFPKVMQQITDNISTDLKADRLADKLLENDTIHLKIKDIIKPHLKKAGLFGATTGFLIGIMNLIIVWLIF